MRGHSSLSGLVVLLLALGVCGLSVPLPRSDGPPSPERSSPPAGTSPALSDLDGDGLADPVLFDRGNLHHHIELYLSRTDERVALPVSVVAGGGSLSAQDLDGDGDTDLFWQGTLPSHTVRVWLNDGVGRFECLCPPDAPERRFALSGPGIDASHARPPTNALSPERAPSPGDAPTVRWDCYVAVTHGSYRPEHVWIVSSLKRPLSTRSPPRQLC